MQIFFSFLLHRLTPEWTDFYLALTRIAIGVIIAAHGSSKLKKGAEVWSFLGTAMQNIGIYFLPTMWGFLASCAEFFGGIALAVGLCTRIAAFFLLFTMVIALFYHLKKKDPFSAYSYSLTLIAIFTCYMMIGGGLYSLDNKWYGI